ncbi:hypothetical protein Mame_02882 [Martelella mediterranea DSM 17316]|uniref:DUF6538 domain-containing protein n=1 Tax=Martelella mediterranea DSM 17316 TaxID=1122214 RepID=A0A1U9Z3C2_9HYPH|nr:hypothetical protein Mame_02882 [Martelella mediterranea DSM 17316]
MSLMRRGSAFCIRRRVPKRFAAVKTRSEIWLNLHTDSETRANVEAPLIWVEQIAARETRLASDTEDAGMRFQAATELAQRRGYRYLTVEKVAALPRAELLERIETVDAQRSEPREAAALLGGVAEPNWARLAEGWAREARFFAGLLTLSFATIGIYPSS